MYSGGGTICSSFQCMQNGHSGQCYFKAASTVKLLPAQPPINLGCVDTPLPQVTFFCFFRALMCLNRQERETRKKISLWTDQFAHLWESLIQGVAMAVVPNTQW